MKRDMNHYSQRAQSQCGARVGHGCGGRQRAYRRTEPNEPTTRYKQQLNRHPRSGCVRRTLLECTTIRDTLTTCRLNNYLITHMSLIITSEKQVELRRERRACDVITGVCV